MTRYVAAYDTEMFDTSWLKEPAPTCLEACRRIVEVHREHGVPATFFIVGKALDAAPDEYRRLLDDPLFEIASHTWSHQLLRDHPLGGSGADPQRTCEELTLSKRRIEEVFGRTCTGIRSPFGFPEGLRGAPVTLDAIVRAGYEYVSSQLWGPEFTLPAPLAQAYTYDSDGFAGLTEYPGHGWHENLLKGHNRVFGMAGAKVLMFPLAFPEAVPAQFVRTPEEEFRYNNKVFIDRACADSLEYVSLIWHPWSLSKMDPDMRMLDMTFRHVRERGLASMTFAQLHAERSHR